MKRFLKIGVLLLVLGLGFKSHANTTTEIEVKTKERVLLAPLGREFHWYKNGELIPNETTASLDSISVSGSYKVEYLDFNGIKETKEVFIIADAKAIKKIFLVGDSTVSNYKASVAPMAGWGQVLQLFINSSAFVVDNRAIGGRSSRSFIEEGRWTEVKSAMTSGDYVMIQFGHNDRDFSKAERYTPPADYKVYLKQYVNESRALGVIPILVTPMVLNAWRNGALRNVFTESGAEYVQKMKEVASELKVPLVDLNQKSWDYVSAAGVDYDTRFIYNTYLAGEYPNYPSGLTDYTHFQEMGALLMAKFIADGINELKSNALVTPIANQLTPLYPLTVNTNVASGGTITKAMSYPQGANITLKALVNSGHTFLNWKNAANTTLTTANIYSFTMPNQAVSYTAIFDSEPANKDCAGTTNGTAKLDNCGVCYGGTTGKLACVAKYEGEDACQVDGVKLESSNAGFSGLGYANTDNAIGTTVQFEINASSNLTASLNVKFANGGTTNRDAILKVNGVTVGNVALAPTGAWSTWANVSTPNINFKSGKNSIVLESSSDQGLANVDFISWANNALSKGNCTITSIEKDSQMTKARLYPNPYQSVFNLELEGDFDYVIINTFGKEISKGMCSDNCQLGQELAPGIYEIKIVQNTQSQTYKFIKE